jgi:membrane protease subunit (stomatin/prohibitin family)
MKSAASNTAGAMTGFMGMGMAGQAGGANMQNLYQMGAQQQAAQQQAAQNMQPASGAGTWKCECGAENTGKFCSECGKPKPQREEWICSCGAVNTGKFCSECGSPRPTGKWTCSCGAVNTGKFCAECGKPRQ